MLSAILTKIAAGTAGLAFTALGARLVLKAANKMNWEPIFAAIERAGEAFSSFGNVKFTAPFYEPIEEFLELKVDEAWARFKIGWNKDDHKKQEEAPK